MERPNAIARPWWILQKLFFATFKRFIPKQSFSLKINFSESTHGLRTATKNCSKTYAAPCKILVVLKKFCNSCKSSANVAKVLQKFQKFCKNFKSSAKLVEFSWVQSPCNLLNVKCWKNAKSVTKMQKCCKRQKFCKKAKEMQKAKSGAKLQYCRIFLSSKSFYRML